MNNKRPVIVGIFILLGLAILVITIFTLGGQKKTFVKSFNVFAVFGDVNGLIKGSNIWFSGVKVGTVKNISFYGDDKVKITMSIENDLQGHIRKDAKVKIGSDGLIGNKIVIIYGGTPNTSAIEKNGYLTAEAVSGTDDMMATLQANNKNLLNITQDFKSISKKIDSGNGTITALINDTMMASNLKATMFNLQTTVSNFKKASVRTNDILSQLGSFSANLNKSGNSVNDLVSDTILYDKIKSSLIQLDDATQALTNFTLHLKTVGEQLNQKQNVAGVLLNDSAAASSLRATLKNMETGSKKLDQDLEALQHNFLLRGFFRKKEKAEAR